MDSGDHRTKNLCRLLVTGLNTVVLAVLFQAVNSSAQTAVTGITYGTLVDGPNATSGGVTYLNRDRAVATVSTGLGDYQFTGPLASNVFFRRNTDSNGNGTSNQSGDNPNNSTLFYQVDGSNRSYGEYETSLEQVFLDGNLSTGLRNPFGNGAG